VDASDEGPDEFLATWSFDIANAKSGEIVKAVKTRDDAEFAAAVLEWETADRGSKGPRAVTRLTGQRSSHVDLIPSEHRAAIGIGSRSISGDRSGR